MQSLFGERENCREVKDYEGFLHNTEDGLCPSGDAYTLTQRAMTAAFARSAAYLAAIIPNDLICEAVRLTHGTHTHLVVNKISASC